MIKIKKEVQIKVIDLAEEYKNKNIEIRWAVITDLKGFVIQSVFKEELEDYSPYIILSEEEGEAIISFHKNDEKFKWRYRNKEICGLTEEIVSVYLNDKNSLNFTENAFDQKDINERLNNAIKLLSNKQKKRIIRYYYENLSEREIAKAEGVDQKTVHESIIASIKKMRKHLLL